MEHAKIVVSTPYLLLIKNHVSHRYVDPMSTFQSKEFVTPAPYTQEYLRLGKVVFQLVVCLGR